MVLVNQELSFTKNMGNYNSAKITIGIHDIDTENDVDEQLAEVKPVIDRIFPKLLAEADRQMTEIENVGRT
jgi:hypothetical protein|tara:strand:+ start:4508 stop:4720 length:213 start_codon:yes stop_codon:yes gene_type:complete